MDIGELRPTIKSAIMYEELTGNDFLSMDMSEADMFVFMYCVYTCTVDRISMAAFGDMFKNRKFASEITLQWKHFERFMSQFKKKEEEEKKEEKKDGKDGENHFSMKEVAQVLVFKYGMDPDYVFNKVELWELDYLISIGEGAYRDKAEEKRLWTYFTIAPHLDPKKSKTMTPSKLFPFPWETNVHTKEGREKVLEKETGRMKKTIGMHLDI